MHFPAKPHLSATVYRNEQGMTLIELLASLSLMVILLGVLAQFLYNGARLWGQGDYASERRRQTLLLSRTLNNDLASLVNSPFLPEPALSGDDYQISFWTETGAGLIQIKYRYDQQTKQVLKTACFWGGKPLEKPVLQKVRNWKIEYFRPRTKNWEMQWKPVLSDEIPSLIRVTARTEQSDLGTLVFSVKVWRKESAANEK